MSTGKGIKRIRNQPVLHDEVKKRHGVLLTDTAWELLARKAQSEETSISEVIEKWARNIDGS